MFCYVAAKARTTVIQVSSNGEESVPTVYDWRLR